MSDTYLIAIIAITYLIVSFLNISIGRRKRWALWVTVFFFVVGIFTTFAPAMLRAGSEPSEAFGAIAFLLSQALALYLLFTKPAREWFMRVNTSESAGDVE